MNASSPPLKSPSQSQDTVLTGTNGSARRNWYPVVNAICFQVCWFICIVQGNFVVVLLSTLLLVAIHLYAKRKDWLAEALTLSVCAFLGITTDQVLLTVGVLEYENGSTAFFIPGWLICLWVAFATAIRGAFSWLHRYPIWAAIFGLLAGPINYWIGAELSPTLAIGGPIYISLITLAIVWLMLLPSLVISGSRLMDTLQSLGEDYEINP